MRLRWTRSRRRPFFVHNFRVKYKYTKRHAHSMASKQARSRRKPKSDPDRDPARTSPAQSPNPRGKLWSAAATHGTTARTFEPTEGWPTGPRQKINFQGSSRETSRAIRACTADCASVGRLPHTLLFFTLRRGLQRLADFGNSGSGESSPGAPIPVTCAPGSVSGALRTAAATPFALPSEPTDFLASWSLREYG